MKPNMQEYEKMREFELHIPEYFNFCTDVIGGWAKKDPNKVALVAVDRNGKAKKYTFADIYKASCKFANVLLNFGAKKGDIVFIMLPRIPEWYACMLGSIKIGAIPAPATTMCTPTDIEYRINRSGAKIVITDEENAEKIDRIKKRCPSLEKMILIGRDRAGWISYAREMQNASAKAASVRTKSTDNMLLFFTSGTTGKPKMVMHTQQYALAHEITARFWQDLKPNDIHWTISDPGWAKAAWGKLFGQWIIGCTVFLPDLRGKFDPKIVPELIQKYNVTTFCAPPTVYRLLILLNLEDYDLGSLRHCVAAGEPLNPEVIAEFKRKTGLLIYDGYGQTETVNLIANYRCMPVKLGSMGLPAPGFDVVIVDENGRELPPRVEGQIALRVLQGKERPPGLFTGYFHDPEKTAKVFKEGLYLTGDKAYRDEDGYFWFVGRADDIIISAGYRIGPFEVESALLEHPAVAESAVIGAPHKLRGEIVKAFIVLAPGYKPSAKLIKELQDHVKRTTAPYKYPREIQFVSALPKTISGKIKRHELREMEKKKVKF